MAKGQYGTQVFEQQAGCAVKVYKNQIGNDSEVAFLYQEILDCNTERTIQDFGGSFSFTLAPTKPWEELIQPNDIVRIFMGDQISSPEYKGGAYNVASGATLVAVPAVDLGARAGAAISPIKVNTPSNIGYSNDGKGVARLNMYERFIGKVDRVEVTEQTSAGQGSVALYTVSGRSLGSIIQDITIYYNEWIEGFNAINIFFNQDVSVTNASPSEFVKDLLAVFLSTVPFPQWQLPSSLVKDMVSPSTTLNGPVIQKRLTEIAAKMQTAAAQTLDQGLQSAAANLFKTIAELSRPGSSPLSCISLEGFKPTYGKTYNKSFINNQNQGATDYLKSLSNEFLNEFFFDICPAGDPEGGKASEVRSIPTFVFRQRPYDLPDVMTGGVADFQKRYAEQADKNTYPDLTDEKGKRVNRSLSDKNMLNSAVDVVGSYSTASVKENIRAATSSGVKALTANPPEITPAVLSKSIGVSGHDLINGFMVLPSFNLGYANAVPRTILDKIDGVRYDAESIRKFGLRFMEQKTIYAQRPDTKSADEDYHGVVADMGQLLSNWYAMNPVFLNGSITCRFLPDARLGIPLRYFQTRRTAHARDAKMELFYIQGVKDTYTRQGTLMTTLTVTRGIRYPFKQGTGFMSGDAITTGISIVSGGIV